MKTIRHFTILVGFSLALFALAVTGAKAQRLSGLSSTNFRGTFTLPVETHWGTMILPAGDYSLEYGTLLPGTYLVTVASEAKGSSRGMILAGARNDVKAAENVLNCIREGNTLFVRALEMPLVGESIHFRTPHGVAVRSKVIAKNHSPSAKTCLSQVAIRIEHAPVH